MKDSIEKSSENEMMEDQQYMLDGLHVLESGKNKYEIDRYITVDGLGTFFFKDGWTESERVFSAIGYTPPELVEVWTDYHYVLKELKDGKWSGNTLYIHKKKPERTSGLTVGEHGVLHEHLTKIASFYDVHTELDKETLLKMLDEPASEELFKKREDYLKLFHGKTVIERTSFDGYLQLNIEGNKQWAKDSEVYSYDEAFQKLKELSNMVF